ncbi:hypothetical protein LTR37_019902 [Vermiconidia calcicola]|uniref:Uncharacterized protein n=1 Tax=Vermiconidia calcicola TaxID=1690605 RepID=A0ACC3ME22_9PEZI|nr:hypothetical protein LTR37_019902 [Vermiconidia calcicola]
MKFSTSIAVAALAELAFCAPTRISKRQSSEGPVGYASLNGGTTGGQGGSETTVSDLDAFIEAVGADSAAIVYVSGTISGAGSVYVTSDKSILGLNSDSRLDGVGLYIKEANNVIVQNLAISNVLADNNDAIGIQESTNV